MANELTVQTALYWVSSTVTGLSLNRALAKSVTVTGTDKADFTVDVTTTAGAIALPANIGTPGYALFQNLDPTNYIELGPDAAGTFKPFVKLKPGEVGLFRIGIAANAIHAKANTATCKLGVSMVED